jgi:phage terminase large subunit-like protein
VTTLLQSVRLVAPRVRSVPDYSFTSGVEAIELAASAGLKLDVWQQAAVNDILAEDATGHWSTFEAALLVPRQNGKGAILEAVELAGLFLFGEDLIIHSAHEFKTAQEAFLRILSLVQNTAELDRKVHRVRTSHGEEGIELKTGKRLRFLARSNGSGRGFSCDRLIYDEAYDLPQETVAASLPTLSARPNPQLIYTSSAALDKSTTLRGVMRRGRRELVDREIPDADPNLCYIEYSADPKADLDDREQWTQANPATESGRIRLDFVAKERSALSEVAFARERLGILDESKGAAVIDLGVWDDAGDVLASPLDPVAFAIDVNPDSSFASIAVAGRTAEGKIFTQVVNRERGTGWVVDSVEELVEAWKPSSVTLDAIGPAGALLPAFAERGISIDVVSMTQYGQACGSFKALVDDGRLVHNAQTGLRAALESARKRPLGESGLWGWHRRDTTDITPLVAVTLATYAHTRNSAPAEDLDNRMFVF